MRYNVNLMDMVDRLCVYKGICLSTTVNVIHFYKKDF